MCVDVSTTTSTIATSPDSAERHKALNEFRRFFYGPSPIIENNELHQAIAEFQECLRTDCGAAGQADQKNDLLRLSHNIANSCAHEIIHGLNVGLVLEAPTAPHAVAQ